MGHARTVAQGFTVVASSICLVVTVVWLPLYVEWWVTLTSFLLLLVPFAANCGLLLKCFCQKKQDDAEGEKRAKNVLLSLQGLGFAGWFLDLVSTVFVVNMNHSGIELNILGWPYAAFGGLAYYVPITFLVCYLLFRVQSKESFYGVVAITVMIAILGARNLGAGLYNLASLGAFNSLTAEIQIIGTWLGFVLILAASNLAILAKSKNPIPKPLTTLNLKINVPKT
jgi:hypothetical protein